MTRHHGAALGEAPMSLKDNIAIHQLFDQLERRYALRILWALRDGYPTKRL